VQRLQKGAFLMTISSSLAAGVSGLSANASKLSTISDNIANSSTYGYKRATTDFHAVVVSGSSGSSYSAGGVQASSMRLIDDRGPLIATSNPTDIAVDGRGFIAVTSIEALGSGTGNYPIALTTTASFRPDENGVLRTSTGEVMMAWPANPDGTMPVYPRDTMSGLVPVQIDINQYVSNPTTQMRVAVNLPATSTSAGSTDGPQSVTVEYFTSLGTTEILDFVFTPTVPATGSSNEWTMTINDSVTGGQVAEITLTFDSSQNSGGRLAAVNVVSGGTYDPLTGKIGLTVGGGTIALELGKIGATNGMTQLSDSFVPVGISKNGSTVATLTTVEIDGAGKMYAIYDQGFSKLIYQLPVIDVPNPNGLIALSNQTYQLSPASGAFYLWDAGDGPTGSVAGYSREESATDVAEELTQLIQTQRAYSSNAKIIQTVDEMWQETTNIKR
jgi:flagellar hook protein FlgE